MVGQVSRIRVAGVDYDIQTESSADGVKTIIFQAGVVVFVFQHDGDISGIRSKVSQLQKEAVLSFLKQK
ncbi:MAG: hypothetical protein VYA30_07570 [Myxococcota bacterium]|nr:hypothetical protein [Myxococcota bacterium]